MREGSWNYVTTPFVIKFYPTIFSTHWCFLAELLLHYVVAKWYSANFIILSTLISWHCVVRKSFLLSDHLFTYYIIMNSMGSYLFNGLWSIHIIIYFDAQIVPDLVKGVPSCKFLCLFNRSPSFFENYLTFWPDTVLLAGLFCTLLP